MFMGGRFFVQPLEKTQTATKEKIQFKHIEYQQIQSNTKYSKTIPIALHQHS
jgi:hypothetical protein